MPPTSLLVATAATAVETGLSYGHALQAGGKRDLPVEALMHFQTRVLGPYRVGAGLLEVAAVAASVMATARGHQDRAARRARGVALAGELAAFATWAAGIQPVNRRLSTWHPNSERQEVPADWRRLRDHWHRLHSLRLGLLSIAVGALVAAGRES